MRKMSVGISAILVTIVTVISFIIYAIYYEKSLSFSGDDSTIWLLSLFGVLAYLFCLYTWKRVSGKYFDMYSIFLSFAFLFNYGQCFMWAFGIHAENEIGVRRLFSLLTPLTKQEIISTQMLSLMGLLSMHCGAVLFHKSRSTQAISNYRFNEDYINSQGKKRKALYEISRVTVVISGLCALYEAIRIIIINYLYGYGASLYNATSSLFKNNIIILLSYMFFASLVGLLIGSRFNNRTRKICYLLFSIYAVLHAIAGDRGEWLYPLIFLVWMHNTYYKKLKKTTVLRYAIVSVILVVLMVGIRNARRYGLSIDTLFEAVSAEENPISSAFFEMGQSMSVAGFFVRTGWGIYPFGNTYILALLGMVTEKFLKYIIPNYNNISGWLSQDYMGIKNSGIGLSLIGEAFENYGPYFCMLALLILGAIFSRIMSTNDIDEENESIILFFKISTAEVLVNATRNQMLTSLKVWSFSTGLMLLGVFLYLNRFKRYSIN